MADINNNFRKITELKSFNQNQIKVAKTYFMMNEIFTGVAKEIKENNKAEIYVSESKSVYSDEQIESNTARQRFAEQPNEQLDTTDMPE